MGLPTIGLLEIHVAHACNLTCESCAHFSNSGHQGILSVQDFRAWVEPWVGKIGVKFFRLLGGEPTLNPHLTELVLLARHYWPASEIYLTTNGFFLHRHLDLGAALGQVRATVTLTMHDRTPEYIAHWQKAVQLLLSWQEKFPFHVRHEIAYQRWTRRHQGVGAQVLPYTDEDAHGSWDACDCSFCRQLFEGKIWKCSPLAYLQLQKRRHPEISSAWDPYLAYRPLEPTCIEQEIRDFLALQAEPACTMCPSRPESFVKPSPLIPLGRILRKASASS